jgi:hypothetical protein
MRTSEFVNGQTSLVTSDAQFERQLHSQPPVFILGIMQRCGTNFLSDILSIHAGFEAPGNLAEDFVMEHAHLLLEYGDRTYRRWKDLRWIKNPEGCKKILLRHIGDGIVRLLQQEIAQHKRLLTKTPVAYNVDKFFHLFPEAKLLILIRDGRDAVESAVRSWPNRSYEYWMKQWSDGARSILSFVHGAGSGLEGKSWQLIRYEDLVERPEAIITDVLRFLGIDPRSFDWQRMQRLPVHGSSQYPDEAGTVTGRKLEKAADFNPLGRWDHWGWYRKRMFKKFAGKELISLGYSSNNRW